MKKLYMNNAATSWPKAPGLENCMAEAITVLPGQGNRATGGENALSRCRSLLAALLKVENANRIVFTQNATQALNLALLGFPWKADDVVLTTAAEHNSVLRPLYAMKQQGMIRDFVVLPVGADGRISPHMLQTGIQDYRPRMFVFAHASNVTGAVNDAAVLAELCRKRHVTTLLDVSQSLGLFPVLPEEWGIDMVAATGHKYLLGPQGTGFLYAAGPIDLSPTLTGGTGIHSDRWTMPDELPLRLEAGTQNEFGLCGLAYSLQWARDNSLDLSYMEENIRILERGLSAYGASPVYVAGMRTPVLAFTCAMPPADMGEILFESYNVICRTGLHCAPLLLRYLDFDGNGSVRLSLSRFTAREDVEEVLEDIREILT